MIRSKTLSAKALKKYLQCLAHRFNVYYMILMNVLIPVLLMQGLCTPAPAPSILFLFCDEKKKNTGQEKETR